MNFMPMSKQPPPSSGIQNISVFFLSTFIILNWSHKERVAVAVVFKWVEDAFVLRPLLGLLLPGTNVVIKLPSSGNSSLMGNADSF